MIYILIAFLITVAGIILYFLKESSYSKYLKEDIDSHFEKIKHFIL